MWKVACLLLVAVVTNVSVQQTPDPVTQPPVPVAQTPVPVAQPPVPGQQPNPTQIYNQPPLGQLPPGAVRNFLHTLFAPMHAFLGSFVGGK
ncbi:hypothetical protein RRG08_043159 [Elysia crispata]|uniref:Uncharacterized protein n=1 Tax=Elysia crispata TaxID=231223 RepID=A0AAE1ARD5_9GAST|nr:hypothetical protein RRG08_043159 [Elysia crispata]